MINRIIEFSGKNKFMVLLLTACGVAVGIQAMFNVPLDAIPDLSDTQVIVYSRWDRSPDIMEDQVTYPIVTAMLGAPGREAGGLHSIIPSSGEDGTATSRRGILPARKASRPASTA